MLTESPCSSLLSAVKYHVCCMGSIYKSTNNNGTVTYYGSVYLDGKRIRKRLANSRPAALKALKKFEYEILFNDDSQEASLILYKFALLEFLKQTELTGISYKYLHVISYTNRRFMQYCFAHEVTYLKDVTAELARAFINDRINNTSKALLYGSTMQSTRRKIAPKTVNGEIQYLKRFFEFCIDLDWIDKNPFRSVKYLKVNKQVQRYYFTEEQIELILNNANEFYDFYMLLLLTGIRATDAYKLTCDNIQDNYLVVQMNKTGDLLNVPLPKAVQCIINRRLEHANNERRCLFTEVSSDRRRRACVKTVQALFSVQFVRDNNINLHTFRHTYAHTMLNKGVPKEVLQTLLGHRSIKTTEIYANWVKKEELEKWV